MPTKSSIEREPVQPIRTCPSRFGHKLTIMLLWVLTIVWFDVYQKQTGAFMLNIGGATEQIYNYVHVFSIIIFTLFFKEKHYLRYSFLGPIAALCGFTALRFFSPGIFTKIIIIASAPGVGLIFVCACYFYASALDNREKFFAIALGFGIARAANLIQPYIESIPFIQLLMTTVLPLLILCILALCTFMIRQKPIPHISLTESKVPSGMYFLLFIVAIVTSLCEDIAYMTLQVSSIQQHMLFFFLGALIGMFVLVALRQLLKISILYVWNVSFALLLVGLLAVSFIGRSDAYFNGAGLLLGGSYAFSYITMFFLMGIIVKKYKSLTFFRAVIFVGAVTSVLSYALTRIVLSSNTDVLVPIVLIAAFVIIMIFFLLSPRYVRELHNAEWMDDLALPDVTHDSRLTLRLRQSGLSPKEIEVCNLLLKGFTMRQISAILSIAYPTVNTYCTNAYRKLGINSRIELLVQFKEYEPD